MASTNDEASSRSVFKAAGVMSVQDIHLALHGDEEDWTEHLSEEGLASLGEMGIHVHEERSIVHRVKPSHRGAVLHPEK